MLEKISQELDESDAVAARAKTAATAAQSRGIHASVGGWWDDLPEPPTGGAASALGTTLQPPQYSVAKPPSVSGPVQHFPGPPRLPGVVPSAPPADEVYDGGGGGGGVGYEHGGFGGFGRGAVAGGGGAAGGVGGGLAMKDAFSSLSLDQVRVCVVGSTISDQAWYMWACGPLLFFVP